MVGLVAFGATMAYYKQYLYQIPRWSGLIVFLLSVLSIFGVAFLRSMLPPYTGDVFIVLFIGLALLGLFLFFNYYYYIKLNDHAISFKKNFLSTKTIDVQYHKIKRLEKIEIYKIPALQFLVDKKRFVISSQGFQSIDEFDELVAFLQNKVT